MPLDPRAAALADYTERHFDVAVSMIDVMESAGLVVLLADSPAVRLPRLGLDVVTAAIEFRQQVQANAEPYGVIEPGTAGRRVCEAVENYLRGEGAAEATVAQAPEATVAKRCESTTGYADDRKVRCVRAAGHELQHESPLGLRWGFDADPRKS